MRVLVTGHEGYIGAVLVPRLLAAGHEVVGLDTLLYRGDGPDYRGDGLDAARDEVSVFSLTKDVRDVVAEDLDGFDAVIHLAAVSNDPIGELNPRCTYEINHEASVRLADVAKRAGVRRFLFSSSCSLYGAAGNGLLDERAPIRPVSAYGRSKVLAERGIAELADDAFSPTFLRNATVYGASPRFRGDLVVNNLVGYAVTTGEVRLMSDGSPWRPLIHVEDVCRAFIILLEAPRDVIHNEAFNVGGTRENYRIRDLAHIVRDAVPGSAVTFADGAGPDVRDYRVSFEKVSSAVSFETTWTVRQGAEELVAFFDRIGLTLDDLVGPRCQRITRVKELVGRDALGPDLRWRTPANVD